MRPLRIYSPCWGAKHLNLLENGLIKSFLWPKNFEVIRHASWTVLAHVSERQKVYDLVSKVVDVNRIDIIESHMPVEQLTAKRGVEMNTALIHVINDCLGDDAQMLMATPDFIFGDGTIPNLVQAAKQRETCVGMPHPRVLPQILDHITHEPLTNNELFDLATHYPHKAWVSSERGTDPSGSHVGGICWRRRGRRVFMGAHRMPSPYLVNFRKDDLDFFSRNDDEKRAAFGAWDHGWACALIEQGRQRTILGSDIAFMAEVTSPEDNWPTMMRPNHNEPDSFWHEDLNHQMNRQFIFGMRGVDEL